LPGNPAMSEAEHELTGKHSTLMLASHVPVLSARISNRLQRRRRAKRHNTACITIPLDELKAVEQCADPKCGIEI